MKMGSGDSYRESSAKGEEKRPTSEPSYRPPGPAQLPAALHQEGRLRGPSSTPAPSRAVPHPPKTTRHCKLFNYKLGASLRLSGTSLLRRSWSQAGVAKEAEVPAPRAGLQGPLRGQLHQPGLRARSLRSQSISCLTSSIKPGVRSRARLLRPLHPLLTVSSWPPVPAQALKLEVQAPSGLFPAARDDKKAQEDPRTS